MKIQLEEVTLAKVLFGINNMETFLHTIGWLVLWNIGMFVIPIITMLLWGFATKFNNEDDARLIFWITFVLYWVVSGVILISI